MRLHLLLIFVFLEASWAEDAGNPISHKEIEPPSFPYNIEDRLREIISKEIYPHKTTTTTAALPLSTTSTPAPLKSLQTSQQAQTESQQAQTESQQAQTESQQAQTESQQAQTESQQAQTESQQAQPTASRQPQTESHQAQATASQQAQAESQQAQAESQQAQAESQQAQIKSQQAQTESPTSASQKSETMNDVQVGSCYVPSLEVFHLQDLTRSYSPASVGLVYQLATSYSKLFEDFPNSKIGLASFRDKPIAGLGDSEDYCLSIQMPLDVRSITERLHADPDDMHGSVGMQDEVGTLWKSFGAGGGGDWFDNQMGALARIAAEFPAMSEGRVLRVVVLSTDSLPHLSPDLHTSIENLNEQISRTRAKALLRNPDVPSQVTTLERVPDTFMSLFEENSFTDNMNCLSIDYPTMKDVATILKSFKIFPIFLLAPSFSLDSGEPRQPDEFIKFAAGDSELEDFELGLSKAYNRLLQSAGINGLAIPQGDAKMEELLREVINLVIKDTCATYEGIDGQMAEASPDPKSTPDLKSTPDPITTPNPSETPLDISASDIEPTESTISTTPASTTSDKSSNESTTVPDQFTNPTQHQRLTRTISDTTPIPSLASGPLFATPISPTIPLVPTLPNPLAFISSTSEPTDTTTTTPESAAPDASVNFVAIGSAAAALSSAALLVAIVFSESDFRNNLPSAGGSTAVRSTQEDGNLAAEREVAQEISPTQYA